MKTKRLGIALGGGGVRGLAHIGILKILERERIPLACLSGASIGGLLCAAYGVGLSGSDLAREALILSSAREMVKIIDLTPLRRGLVEGKGLRAFLEAKMGAGITFRDSRIPIALVCADLPRGETVVLTSDSTPSCSLIDAVMATCAFPGIFPPVRLEDRLLVDGGLLNNVPADAVRQLGAEVVIAVDVNPTIPRQLTPEQYLEQRQLPRFIPAPAEALYQASMVMTAALVEMRLREAKPDLILRPELPEDITVFWGFHRAAEAITAGEEAAMRALPAIRQLLQ